MNDELAEEDLFDLFRNNLAHVTLTTEAAEKLQQLVMAEVATLQEAAPLQTPVEQTSQPAATEIGRSAKAPPGAERPEVTPPKS